jgi:hypothetical protein
MSQARSGRGREECAGDGSLSTATATDAGGDFRRFTTAVSEAAGDRRSAGEGLLTVVLGREPGGGLAAVGARSRSLRRACWRCSRKDIIPPTVMGALSASLAATNGL